METDFEGQRGFAAASAESEAEMAAITIYRDAVGSRPADPDLLTRIGLWNSDPNAALAKAASAFAGGDLPGSAESAAYAKKIWTTAAEVGRNRVLAVGASLAAILLAGWLVVRALRDRSVRRRSLVVPER
jgi:hypothetical protein